MPATVRLPTTVCKQRPSAPTILLTPMERSTLLPIATLTEEMGVSDGRVRRVLDLLSDEELSSIEDPASRGWSGHSSAREEAVSTPELSNEPFAVWGPLRSQNGRINSQPPSPPN